MWFYQKVGHPNDADRTVKSEDPNQTADQDQYILNLGSLQSFSYPDWKNRWAEDRRPKLQ